jgi:hypothetical protein
MNKIRPTVQAQARGTYIQTNIRHSKNHFYVIGGGGGWNTLFSHIYYGCEKVEKYQQLRVIIIACIVGNERNEIPVSGSADQSLERKAQDRFKDALLVPTEPPRQNRTNVPYDCLSLICCKVPISSSTQTSHVYKTWLPTQSDWQ